MEGQRCDADVEIRGQTYVCTERGAHFAHKDKTVPIFWVRTERGTTTWMFAK